MYEAYAKELLARIEAQEAEIARLGTMAEQTRADAVTRAAADEKRIAALRHECERWKAAYSDRCALLDVIHASLGIDKDDNVICEIDRIHKARNGLQAQVQDLRAALAKEQELHAATALRLATEAAKLVERKKHPVKVGEWVRRTDAECESIHWGLGVVAQVMEVYSAEQRYNVTRPDWNGDFVPWDWELCTPCDPPTADHDTPAGKAAAESVIRDSRKTETADEIKVGDDVEVFQATHEIWTRADEIGTKGTVKRIDAERLIPVVFLSNNGAYALQDVRKVTP